MKMGDVGNLAKDAALFSWQANRAEGSQPRRTKPRAPNEATFRAPNEATGKIGKAPNVAKDLGSAPNEVTWQDG
jgi:hypothetical protein